MATSAELHELVSRGKNDLKPAKHTVAKSISPSATEPDATNTQPPEASLLGLPKELLNYIIELAVVKRPGEGPTESKVDSKQLKTSRQLSGYHMPTPALGRTCKVLEAIVLPIYWGQHNFVFHSPSQALRWLSMKRRRNGMAMIRQVKIRFKVKGMENMEDGDNLDVHLVLQDGIDRLLLAGRCSFCARACQWCQRILLDKIEDINSRTGYYESGLERILAMLEYLSDRPNLRFLADEGWACGCDWATQQ